MSVTDRQVERYGADAPQADLQPCFNDATHGITAGDCTQHLCSDHVAPTLYGASGNVSCIRCKPSDAASTDRRSLPPSVPDALGACWSG